MIPFVYQLVKEAQQPLYGQSPVIIYDRSGRWQQFLPEGETIQIGGYDPTRSWDIVREIDANGDDEPEDDSGFETLAELILPTDHSAAERDLIVTGCTYLQQDEGRVRLSRYDPTF